MVQHNRGRLFVSFGESHLAVLDLTDFMVGSLCSELPLPASFSSKSVNFYPAADVYGSSEGGSLHPLNNVTKSDEDPGNFGELCMFIERSMPEQPESIWTMQLHDTLSFEMPQGIVDVRVLTT